MLLSKPDSSKGASLEYYGDGATNATDADVLERDADANDIIDEDCSNE